MNDVAFAIMIVWMVYLPLLVYILYQIVKRYHTKQQERGIQRKAEVERLTATLTQKQTKNAPSPLKNLEVVESDNPVKVNSIAPDDEWETDSPSNEFSLSSRTYRIYRSTDQSSWVECDPALTERAACNYGHYIKKNNPNEYVRVNDPDGLILYYE